MSKEFTNPTDALKQVNINTINESIKYIVGNGSADNIEDLIQLYKEFQFEGAYQFASAVVQFGSTQEGQRNLSDQDCPDMAYRLNETLEEYHKSGKTLREKLDFIWSVEYEVNKSAIL